jgi:hypothetical protein
MSPETIRLTLAVKPNGLTAKEWLYPTTKHLTWGTSVIPKSKWINTSKSYVTRNGFKVEINEIVLLNSLNNEVSYPVKATILLKKATTGKIKKVYSIYTLDGQYNLDNPHEYDLIEVS